MCSAWPPIPLTVVFIAYLVMAKNSPECPPAKSLAEYFKVLKDKDAWWFMFFYSVTFGGFVGLAASLTIYFNTQYGLSPVIAGYFTAACVFAGSMVRPIGGMVADRVGGIRSLSVMYLLAAVFLAIVSVGLPHAWLALAVVRRRDARTRHGQRRGVPAGAAALPQGDRRDDRPGRHGRRRGRLSTWRRASAMPSN